MSVRQSAESSNLRNSAAELKPNPNSIPDFKPPILNASSVLHLYSAFHILPETVYYSTDIFCCFP